MTDRGTVDPTRQGIAAPEPDPLAPQSVEPVSVEQALAAVAGWQEQGMPLFGLHQVAIALAGEVERVRSDLSARDELERRESTAWRNAYRDANAKLDAALAEIIGCSTGDPATCTRDDYGWASCCRSRFAAVRCGLLKLREAPVQEDDGA